MGQQQIDDLMAAVLFAYSTIKILLQVLQVCLDLGNGAVFCIFHQERGVVAHIVMESIGLFLQFAKRGKFCFGSAQL